MAYKLEISGSALKITDTATLEDVLIPRRLIWYNDNQLDRGYVTLTGLDYAVDNEFKSAKFFQKETILLNECVDAEDVVFTKEAFLTFVSTNFSEGGGNGSGVTLDELFVVERDAEGNIIKTISIYDLQVPPESIEVGESIRISDLGQLPAYTTKFDAHKYLMMGYGFDDSGSQLPKVKVFGAQTDFELQPNDSVTETFVTPVDFTITSQQNVIGERYTLKILSDADVRFNVIRVAENGGEDTQLVDEIIPQADLSLNGASFDLTPLVDFSSNKVYRLVFSTENGTIDIKGFNAPTQTNANGVSRAVGTTFIPYIKRELGWEYEEKNVSLSDSTTTTRVVGSDDATIFADGAKATKDPNGIEGWHFNNSADPNNKINWYYINNANVDSDMTLGGLDGMYAVANIYNPQEFYFQVYTKRKNDGQDVSWYRSRITYLTTGQFAQYVGQRVLVYWGQEPNVELDLPRVKMEVEAFTTIGLQEADEEIFLGSLSTSTNYPEDTYKFTINAVGYQSEGVLTNLPMIHKFDDTELNTKLNELEAYLEAVRQGKFFRGYVMDEAEMLALSNPFTFEYVARVDTATIWEYDGVEWYDTLLEMSLSGISQAEQLALSYSDTRYLELDGSNDYINLIDVPTDVMDYTKSWSLGIELDGLVDPVNDSTYITLFKRGNNEVTLRKGGTNWGIYVYSAGVSVAQANTWRAPYAGSKILVVSTGSRIRYYLNGEQRANMLVNSNVSLQDPSGDLEIGNGGQRGSNWTGGVNNLMIMVGSGAIFGKDQLTEYFAQGNVSNMSFYPSVTDFLAIGERPYPSVLGLKQVVSGTLENSTESAVIVRGIAGDIGVPFPQAPGRYVFLDGTDNYIEFDNANTDIGDYTKKWAFAMSLKSVSGITDNQKTVLMSRGKNEITLVRGGGNWGFYCYANGLSVGQANTWYAPNADSTIVVICTGSKVEYYLNGARRANVSINANVSAQDPTGNLKLGENYLGSHTNWYGGVENSFLISGDDALLSSAEVNEFVMGVDPSNLSYYANLDDFFQLGSGTYPATDGVKGSVTGNLINGTSEDFVNI